MSYFSNLIFLCVIAGIALWWWSSQGVRQMALRLSKQRCDQLQLQFLDETVVLRKLWLKRDSKGSLRLLRIFTFEFTSIGDVRYMGRIEILGKVFDDFYLEPYRTE